MWRLQYTGDILGSHKIQKEEKGKKATFRISLQITAVALTIFIIASLVCLILYQRALGDMADSSKEKVVESTVSIINSSHYFVARMIMFLQVLRGEANSYGQIEQGLQNALAENKEAPIQKNTNDLLKQMIDSDFLGFTLGYFTIPPASENENAVIAASSDKKYIGETVPDEVAAIAESKNNYYLFEEGIPEMGLEGQYLVTSYKLTEEDLSGLIDQEAPDMASQISSEEVLWYFDFKPMGKLLSGIDDFYNKENRNAILMFCLAIGLSIIILITLSFSVLGYQIKKRVSGPIDELSTAAEKVIEGDMDVRLDIKKREEFSALKSAFNQMISTISGVISMALGEQERGDLKGGQEDKGDAGRTYLKPRSNLLIRIIVLFTIVFICAGASYIVTIGRSMNSLVDKSKDTLIDSEGKLIMSGHKFGGDLATLLTSTQGQAYNPELIKEFLAALSNKTISNYQRYANEMLRMMVEGDLFGYKVVYITLPPGPLTKDCTVVFSSDEKYIYTKPPKEICGFYDIEGDDYFFFKNGIPKMGFDEPYLTTCYKMPLSSLTNMELAIVDFKPMGDEVKAVDKFFNDETARLMINMGIVIGISILLLVFITALTLTYLIRKQITGPIEELVSVVDEVMEGNLDIQVQIRPGEKLESLKTAFNEMIKTLRDIIERSTEG